MTVGSVLILKPGFHFRSVHFCFSLMCPKTYSIVLGMGDTNKGHKSYAHLCAIGDHLSVVSPL